MNYTALGEIKPLHQEAVLSIDWWLTWWQRVGDGGLIDGQGIVEHGQRTDDDGDFPVHNRSRSVLYQNSINKFLQRRILCTLELQDEIDFVFSIFLTKNRENRLWHSSWAIFTYWNCGECFFSDCNPPKTFSNQG